MEFIQSDCSLQFVLKAIKKKLLHLLSPQFRLELKRKTKLFFFLTKLLEIHIKTQQLPQD
jgi:hypothetical protein